MGVDTKTLRSRIKSVESTQHLVKAMGLVASSRIRRASLTMVRAKQYKEAVSNIIRTLASSSECRCSVYMAQSDESRPAKLIVIAGDRGLAGGYNNNVFRLVKTLDHGSILPIGKRAFERYNTGEETFYTVEHITKTHCAAIAGQLCREFAAGKISRVGIVYTRYVSVLTQEPDVLWVLPLSAEETPEKQQGNVLFEPNPAEVLETAVYEYVCGILYAAVRESYACEVAARRNAMDSAGKNAKKMTDDLTLQYNRARQGAITQEITEIVAGSGA